MAGEPLVALKGVTKDYPKVSTGGARLRTLAGLLFRRKDKGLRPDLRLSVAGGDLVVTMLHRTHVQIADLRVQATDALGRTWSCRPTGEWSETPSEKARPGLLLFPSGTRPVELFRARLPEASQGAAFVEVRVVLQNPGASQENVFADVSDRRIARL